MTATLMTLGATWIFHATIIPTVMRTRAMSDAMQLEANLKAWTSEKVLDGKLQEDDVGEIFPQGYSLRFGGESPNKNFRKMISDISQSSAPPAWPGVLSILIGGAGAVSCLRAHRTKQSEQSAT